MYKNSPPLVAIVNLAADGRTYDGDHHKNFFFIEILKRIKDLEEDNKELKKMEWGFEPDTTVGIQIDEWRDLIGWDADDEIPP